MFGFLKRKEIVKPFPVPEYIVFNVENFNNWFNDDNNNAIYANKGIFLRLDKLSESQITDYIEKCYGLSGGFLWSKPTHEMIYMFYEEIRKNWQELIRLQNNNKTKTICIVETLELQKSLNKSTAVNGEMNYKDRIKIINDFNNDLISEFSITKAVAALGGVRYLRGNRKIVSKFLGNFSDEEKNKITTIMGIK